MSRRATISHRRAALVLAAAVPFVAAPAAAQSSVAAAAARFDRAGAVAADALPTVLLPRAASTAASRFGPSTVLHGGAGALIGGFFGYLLSQVVVSNWDVADGGREPNRTPYIAGGAVLGAFTGVSVDLWGRPRSGPGAGPVVPVLDRVNVLERDEIVAAGATDLYQLVRARRNQWLVPRGNNSLRDGATSRHVDAGMGAIQVLEGGDYVTVYVDGVRLGGVERLADILPMNTERLEYLDPGQATLRFGGGNSHGTIHVTSRRATAPDASGTP